jgi:hypothetical protein
MVFKVNNNMQQDSIPAHIKPGQKLPPDYINTSDHSLAFTPTSVEYLILFRSPY